ncbi:hypothetical protein ACFSKU_06965 [Pontibacter silvestris]|uniref:Uncharacterized protein n=1 Tax=Pontibacter silvestris TaxID=2305183 RepID=A0ABW4WX87_9BACT|nr:hypothetical protein [Pontibacter silvestris]MCC9136530.1 hypothetical protein [Pontibacter silvestris]
MPVQRKAYVAAFTNAEEEAKELTNVVPFLLEAKRRQSYTRTKLLGEGKSL